MRPAPPIVNNSAPPGRIAAPDLPRSALVMIDWQRAFFAGSVPTAESALARALSLAEVFRGAGRPVVWTRHAHGRAPEGGGMGRFWNTFLMDGSDAAELVVQPAPGERVFRKETYSAFRKTRLGPWLRTQGVVEVVVAGLQTHLCVDATARGAFAEGFDVIVVSDATTAPVRHGVDLHALALTLLSQSVARVLPVRTWST